MRNPSWSRATILLLAMLATLVLLPGDLQAAQAEGDRAVAEQEGEAEAEEGAEFRNEVALIIVGTYEGVGDEHPENLFTIGGKYQREVNSLIAVAGAFEYLNNKPAVILVLPVHFRVWKNLDVYAGPGVEFSEEEEEGEHDEGEDHDADEDGDSGSGEASFLVRVGVGWLFEIGERYSFSPGVAIDFIGREQALVYGAEFSVKF